MSDAALNALFQAYEQAEQAEKDAKKKTSEIKAAIREEVEARGVEVVDGDGWRATLKEVHSNSFDTKTFAAEHKRLYQQYLKEGTATRFTLNRIKGTN